MTRVNTKLVTNRQVLKFTTTDEALNHALEIARWEREGVLKTLGNWSPGEALGHLATWVGYSYDGLPFEVPWFMRLLGPLLKGRALKGPMPAGWKFSQAPGGTWGTEPISTEQGLGQLRRAMERLRTVPPIRPHPFLGTLTPAQWTAAHLRHAELHLSFFAKKV